MKAREKRQAHNQPPEQLSIFNPTKAVARRNAPQTSHDAAASVNLPEKCQRVLYLLTKYGPMTDEEMNDRARQEGFLISNTGMAPARCMMSPPNGRGIVNTGTKRTNRSGSKAIVWDLERVQEPSR
jgi:hypothetical protein